MDRMSDRRASAHPLDGLPDATRRRIAELVSLPTPPPRWIKFELCQMESRAWYEWHWARGIDPGLRREPLPPTLRQRVIDRDGYVCQICKQDVEPGDVHIDHIKPYSKGGRHVLRNLQVTHSTCNLRKGAKYDGEDSGL